MWLLIFAGLVVCFGYVLIYGAPYVPSPVSYTHLRAHETVLDLVCRLLLEKKQKHKKKKK